MVLIHGSSQNLIVVSSPIIHLELFITVFQQWVRFFQIKELLWFKGGSIKGLDLEGLCEENVKYILLRMDFQIWLLAGEWNHLARELRRVVFWYLAYWIWRPPNFFGRVIMFQFKRWILLPLSDEPQMKSQIVLLIELVVFVGRLWHCIMCVGIEDRTTLARVTLPAIIGFLVFQFVILALRAIRMGEKFECFGARWRRGKPK